MSSLWTNWQKIATGVVAAGAAFLLYKAVRAMKAKVAKRKITSMFIYPVKSLAGMQVTEWPVDDKGLLHDRRWMIVRDSDYVFLTLRQVPRMAHISAAVTHDGKLTLTSQDASISVHALPPEKMAFAKRLQIELWKQKFEAFDCGDEVADWLSKKMNVNVRLVEFAADQNRPAEAKIVDYVTRKENDSNRKVLTAFPDEFPFQMVSEASLAELNRKSPVPLEMKRFRPNIVIAGDGMAGFEEDTYKVFDIVHEPSNSKIRMYNVKPCTRCSIPTIEPQTAVFQDAVGKMLKKERLGAPNTPFAGEVMFGIGLCHELKLGYWIHVGDTLSFVEMQQAPKVASQTN